jgi:2-keto-3-deoxy-6-phosphogluconate aldolase
MKTLDLANYGPVIPVIVIDKVEDAVPMTLDRLHDAAGHLNPA